MERVGIPLDPAVATCRHQPTHWTLAPRELHAGEGLVLRKVERLTKEVHQRVRPQWGTILGFSNLSHWTYNRRMPVRRQGAVGLLHDEGKERARDTDAPVHRVGWGVSVPNVEPVNSCRRRPTRCRSTAAAYIWALPGEAGRTRVSHLHVKHCMRFCAIPATK